MFNYYDVSRLIQDIDKSMNAKEKELESLKTIINGDIITKIKIQQLLSEINELRIQKDYYSNTIQDQLMTNCSGCGNCCKNKYFF